MEDFVYVLVFIALIWVGTFFMVKAFKKKAPKRLPHRVDIAPQFSQRTAQAVTLKREPRAVNNDEYLTYRNCPDCHSENARNRQIIYKIGTHEYVCHICGRRFTFGG